VAIAGQSAGGLSVLAQLVSTGARGLFQAAIIQSGTFALNQQPLATAEAAGQAFAGALGCPGQTAQTAACLRRLPVSDLVTSNFIGIPGVVDGKVLTEPIGAALAAGRFAHVPVLNGTNHDEERLFVQALGVTVSGGTFVPIPDEPVTPDNYQANIAAVLGVSADRAAAIAAEYPPAASPLTYTTLSTLVADANFACPALQVDQETAQRVPTYAYEFNDDNAPQPYTPFITVATHESELPYLFDLPNAPFHGTFSPGQQTLAASMRAAWVNFAATGNPASAAVPWPAFGDSAQMLSLVPPQPQLETDFPTRHHCAFWAAG
jgi:para-nitrobenzyl esterase